MMPVNLPPFSPGLFLIFIGVFLVHIAAGFIAMLSGLMPLFTPKGGREHKSWGRVFIWTMGVTSFTAFPLAYWRSDLFQAEVGVFSGYLTFFGLRIVQKNRSAGQASPLDWAAAVVSFLVFLLLGAAGASALVVSPARPQARASLLFGLLGLLVAGRDIYSLVFQDFSRRRRVIDHMVALSLALLTGYAAFLNTQLYRLTGLNWPLDAKMGLPFAIGVPILLFWAFIWDKKLRLLPAQITQEKQAQREPIRMKQGQMKQGQMKTIRITSAKKRKARETYAGVERREAEIGFQPQLVSKGPAMPPPKMSTPAEPSEERRLRHLGIAEGISFLLLLCIAVPLKHLLGLPMLVRVLGPIHGGLFILYVVAVFQAAPVLQWSARQIALALGAGVVPGGTFVLEAKLRKSQR